LRADATARRSTALIRPPPPPWSLPTAFFPSAWEPIIDDKKAFVNFDRTVLIGGMHTILPPDVLVVEILESVEPDPEVLAACATLATQGYAIALDDFVSDPRMDPLLRFANIIKIDIQATNRPEQARLIKLHKPRGVAILAEKS